MNEMLDGPQGGSGYFGKEISLMSFVPAGNRTLGRIGATWGGWVARGANASIFFLNKNCRFAWVEENNKNNLGRRLGK